VVRGLRLRLVGCCVGVSCRRGSRSVYRLVRSWLGLA
jgi:hypothetical protein